MAVQLKLWPWFCTDIQQANDHVTRCLTYAFIFVQINME